MKTQPTKIECPECGCKEIHWEYNNYGSIIPAKARLQSDEGVPVEPMWCYCLGCGVMFDPVQESFAM